jgi:hypothetical protein
MDTIQNISPFLLLIGIIFVIYGKSTGNETISMIGSFSLLPTCCASFILLSCLSSIFTGGKKQDTNDERWFN